MTQPNDDIKRLYEQILTGWNQQDVTAMAAPFAEDAILVGFDGSQIVSRAGIEAHLQPIFADHPTAVYIAKVREVRPLHKGVWQLKIIRIYPEKPQREKIKNLRPISKSL